MFGPRHAPLELGRLLGEPSAGVSVGLEHEYTVRRERDGAQLDFAHLVHELRLGRRHLDPDDPNAYRLPSGAVVTADKAEAEIALPPVEVARGFAPRIAAMAGAERAALAGRMPGCELTGYSTHLSVEVPEGLEVDVGRLYVNRFGPAMLLAMDGPDAPGVRIRPRHGRLELCGDYLEGARLEHAVELAAGSVAACVAALHGPGLEPALPPTIACRWLPAIERRGWFVDRRLLGLEGSGGADGRFGLVGGGSIAAREQVHASIAIARGALDAITPRGAPATGATDPHGDLLRPRHRAGLDVAPVMATWPLSVFVAASADRAATAFVAVPRRWLRGFLAGLDRGDLDESLRRALGGARGERSGPAPRSWSDVRRPGLFAALGPRLALLPPEPM